MKKGLIIIAVLLLTGCAGLDTTFAILDVLAGDTTVHQGVVREVLVGREATTIRFEDGMSYEIMGAPYAWPGQTVKIVKTENGYRAETL
jgi:hypothetical protein